MLQIRNPGWLPNWIRIVHWSRSNPVDWSVPNSTSRQKGTNLTCRTTGGAMGAIMKAKPAPGRTATTAALLVQHLSMNVDEDDMQSVVRLLSDALDLARAKVREAPEARTPTDGPSEPDYWVG